jgi:preprotein translocase subunit YajC
MISEAFAFGPTAGGAQGANPYQPIIMLVLMFAIFYFLLIRPQQKKAKQHRDLIEALKTGDNVITAGGIHGKVTAVQEDVITLEVATGVKIRVTRNSIAGLAKEQ